MVDCTDLKYDKHKLLLLHIKSIILCDIYKDKIGNSAKYLYIIYRSIRDYQLNYYYLSTRA